MADESNVLLDAVLRPDPDGDNELAAQDAVAIADEHIGDNRVLVVQRRVPTAPGAAEPQLGVELVCTFHPAAGARFSEVCVALKLQSPAGIRVLELAPRFAEPPEAACTIRGSGEATSLAKWTFHEQPRSRRGIGNEHRVRLTLPAIGVVQGGLAITARLARPSVGAVLDELRDLVTGRGATTRFHPFVLEPPAQDDEPVVPSVEPTNAMLARTMVDDDPGNESEVLVPPPPSATLDPRPRPTREAPLRIQLLTANALDPDRKLAIDEELRDIAAALRSSKHPELYVAEFSHAVTFEWVVGDLDERAPDIVHFCGHGDPTGDIILRRTEGGEQRIAPAAMARLLVALRKRPTLITFATCHSLRMAELAAQHVAYAIGFEGRLLDGSARRFSSQLYERLAAHDPPDVRRAFNLAKLACESTGVATIERAQLFVHPAATSGADPTPQGGPEPMPEIPSNERDELIDAFINVYWDRTAAITMLRRADYPQRQIPPPGTSQEFWTAVASQIAAGAFPGGWHALGRMAAKDYPANPIFKRYQPA